MMTAPPSMFRATAVTGYRGHTLEELPLHRVREILVHHRVLPGEGGA